MAEASGGLHPPGGHLAAAIQGGQLIVGPATGPAWRALPLEDKSVSAARDITEATLSGTRAKADSDHVDNLHIVVSELVTNAVRHTASYGTLLYLGIAVLPQWTHVLVEDPLPDAPAPAPIQEPDPDSIDSLLLSGRGLGIVRALSARFRFVVRNNDKTAHAVVLRSDVKLTSGQEAALDRLVSV